MLDVREAAFRYEGMAMSFTLDVAAGECVAVIGPSGAGKSTLLSLIAGFDRTVSGSVLVDGTDITAMPPWSRPVDIVFQEHNLFAHLDAAANVGLGIDPGLRLGSADRLRIDRALADVGLAGLGDRRPAQLSGGERQRVALARVLVRGRPVLLLDEPFAALGPALRREMLDLVARLRDERQVAVLMVSHHPGDARRVASRTAFVHDGRVLDFGTTDRVLAGTRAELRDYLGEVLE